MSRTRWCIITALVLIGTSTGVMLLRYTALGGDVALPMGPETWKISFVAQGTSEADARLTTLTPRETIHQHILKELTQSDRFTARFDEDRNIIWSPQANMPPGRFRLSYEVYLSLNDRDTPMPTDSTVNTASYLRSNAVIDSDHPELSMFARDRTAESSTTSDKVQTLFDYVANEIDNEPRIGDTSPNAIECFQSGSGDALAKARLLVALLRNREIPARIIMGLPLIRGSFTQPHYWVEAYFRGQWLPMCPLNRHFGRIPQHWIQIAIDNDRLITSKNVNSLDTAFLVEPITNASLAESTWLRRWFTRFSPFALPTAERSLVEFLLLMPLAALVVCISRNIIGLTTFGTFTPALLGLAFREIDSVIGVLIFVAILLAGWVLRRLLNHYHLLQVPRLAVMLSLVVSILIAFIVIVHAYGGQPTRYVSLFPLVILTGMIERFWTLEEEDGTATSFRTLFSTILVAAIISAILSRSVVINQLTSFPETLGIIMAIQLLIGRYTGYRLLELYRFRDFIRRPPTGGNAAMVFVPNDR